VLRPPIIAQFLHKRRHGLQFATDGSNVPGAYSRSLEQKGNPADRRKLPLLSGAIDLLRTGLEPDAARHGGGRRPVDR
jgi:hypothetical protein